MVIINQPKFAIVSSLKDGKLFFVFVLCFILCGSVNIFFCVWTVADTDLQISGGGGGGVGGQPDPELGGGGAGLQESFFRLFGPHLVEK